MKKWSREEGLSPKTSSVGQRGCYKERGCQNLILVGDSKNNEWKNNIARFSWFEAIFVIKKWSRVEGSGPNTSDVGPHG